MSEGSKRYQERHRKLGLCLQCSRKAKAGLLYCQVCLTRMRERKMLRHPLFCPECKKLIRPEERNRNRFHKLCAEVRRARRELLTHRSAAIAYQERHRKMGCLREVFVGSTTRWHKNGIMKELLVEWWRVK